MRFLPQVFKWVSLIMTAVGAVERLGTGLKGKQKQDAAVNLTGEMLPLIEGMVGRDVVDDEKVQDVVRETIDVVVKLQNTVNDAIRRREIIAAGPSVVNGKAATGSSVGAGR